MSVALDRLESKEEVELAKAAQRRIAMVLDPMRSVGIAANDEGMEKLDDAPLLSLPPRVLRMIGDLLGALAQGKAVAIMPKELDVTTQEAAAFLNVSRPYVVGLLEANKMPHHKVGTHRRIRFEDLVRYKEDRKIASDNAIQALVDQAQELGLGY
jgi:excisionase family DNA binding protein